MAAKSSPGGFVVATVTNPGSFMATITHPTGNGYCLDRILRDRTGSGYISTCHIKDPLTVFTHPLHIIIAMSYRIMPPLTVIGPPSHIIIAVPYNGPPCILSLQYHNIMDSLTVFGPRYISLLHCHKMQSIDAVKEYLRSCAEKLYWQLMTDLKKQFQIL